MLTFTLYLTEKHHVSCYTPYNGNTVISWKLKSSVLRSSPNTRQAYCSFFLADTFLFLLLFQPTCSQDVPVWPCNILLLLHHTLYMWAHNPWHKEPDITFHTSQLGKISQLHRKLLKCHSFQQQLKAILKTKITQ